MIPSSIDFTNINQLWRRLLSNARNLHFASAWIPFSSMVLWNPWQVENPLGRDLQRNDGLADQSTIKVKQNQLRGPQDISSAFFAIPAVFP